MIEVIKFTFHSSQNNQHEKGNQHEYKEPAQTIYCDRHHHVIDIVSGHAGNGGDDDDDTGGDGTVLTVSCIEWAATGGRDQHIHVQAFVSDENGDPVLGAEVSMKAMKDGVEYNIVGGPTENFAGLEGGVDCPDGPPGTGVTRDFCVNKADTGFYDVEVLSVSKEGYTWDGETPDNGYDHVKP